MNSIGVRNLKTGVDLGKSVTVDLGEIDLAQSVDDGVEYLKKLLLLIQGLVRLSKAKQLPFFLEELVNVQQLLKKIDVGAEKWAFKDMQDAFDKLLKDASPAVEGQKTTKKQEEITKKQEEITKKQEEKTKLLGEICSTMASINKEQDNATDILKGISLIIDKIFLNQPELALTAEFQDLKDSINKVFSQNMGLIDQLKGMTLNLTVSTRKIADNVTTVLKSLGEKIEDIGGGYADKAKALGRFTQKALKQNVAVLAIIVALLPGLPGLGPNLENASSVFSATPAIAAEMKTTTQPPGAKISVINPVNVLMAQKALKAITLNLPKAIEGSSQEQVFANIVACYKKCAENKQTEIVAKRCVTLCTAENPGLANDLINTLKGAGIDTEIFEANNFNPPSPGL